MWSSLADFPPLALEILLIGVRPRYGDLDQNWVSGWTFNFLFHALFISLGLSVVINTVYIP